MILRVVAILFVGLPKNKLLCPNLVQSQSTVTSLMLFIMFSSYIIFCMSSKFLFTHLPFCYVTITLLPTQPLIMFFILAPDILTLIYTSFVTRLLVGLFIFDIFLQLLSLWISLPRSCLMNALFSCVSNCNFVNFCLCSFFDYIVSVYFSGKYNLFHNSSVFRLQVFFFLLQMSITCL